MQPSKIKTIRQQRRKRGIRRRILGVPDRPRMSVFRSNQHLYAQIIDDLSGRTLVSASSLDKKLRQSPGGNRHAATAVGSLLAERAREAGIERVALDRNGYLYHGRVKAMADAAREGGLQF